MTHCLPWLSWAMCRHMAPTGKSHTDRHRVSTCDAASWANPAKKEESERSSYCSPGMLINSALPQLCKSPRYDQRVHDVHVLTERVWALCKEEAESDCWSSGSHLSALPTVTWQMCSEAKCTTAACSKSGLPFSPLPLSSCGVQCQPCWNHHSLSWYVSTSHTSSLTLPLF